MGVAHKSRKTMQLTTTNNNIFHKEYVMETGKNHLNMWDRVMMAITFAESGDAETARDMLGRRTGKEQRPESKDRKKIAKHPQLRV